MKDVRMDNEEDEVVSWIVDLSQEKTKGNN